ncbi:MAG: hypothetical protein ACLGI6_08230 [Gammaproteobacteria bacterium]
MMDKRSSLRSAAPLLALAAALALHGSPAAAQYAETKIDRSTAPDLDRPQSNLALRPIVNALTQQDCAGAIKALKNGLNEQDSDVMLMAGTMYERGLCVKKNWDQASDFYQMADAKGNQWARKKLVAGLASEGDAGGALYWASRLPRVLPAQCYGKVDADKDPDGFAAELNQWTRERLDGCVYIAGVVNAIAGEMRYPAEAAAIGVWGTVAMKFTPASATVEWTSVNHETRVLPGLQIVEPDTPLAHRGQPEKILVNHGKLVSDQALQRFKRPAGIAADLVVTQNYDFDFK